MPNDRTYIKNEIKKIVRRQPADIDETLALYINTGVELFGSMIESVYEQSMWEHTITQAEVDADVNNWLLPNNIKRVISGALIDVIGTEEREVPLLAASAADKHRVGEISEPYRYDPTMYPTQGWDWDIGRRR